MLCQLMRTSDGLPRVKRPVLYDHLTCDRIVVAINFATDDHLHLLKTFGLGGVPCNNPTCHGVRSKKEYGVRSTEFRVRTAPSGRILVCWSKE